MEVEVRVVGGIENCFVSLPLSLIQTLERGLERERGLGRENGGFVLPPVLGLELRSLSGGDGRKWFVAWSGSPSRSSSIEVPQHLAECISLPDGMIAELKAIPVLTKAETVNIEPASEDDWEILEFNYQLAEQVILRQVGVVYEGMKFPLWLHEHVLVEFIVTSCSPKKPIVQLVPGTEVIVAPKVRKDKTNQSHDLQKKEEIIKTKGLLRVQSGEKKYVHRFEYKGVELGVTLTYCVLINPETGKKILLDNLDFVTLSPKFLPKESGNSKSEKNVGMIKGVINANSRERNRNLVVSVLFSDSVAKGHLMLAQPLLQFLRTNVHSWVYVKKYSFHTKKASPLFTISPFRFKIPRKSKTDENSEFDLFDRENNNNFLRHNSISLNYIEDFIASLSKEEGLVKKEKEFLIKSWLIGQIKATTLQIDKKDPKSFIFPNESLLHFEVIDKKSGNRKMELMYLLSVNFERFSDGNSKENFELGLEGNLENFDNFEPGFGKLDLGDPVSLETISENSTNKKFELDLSSLSWMESAISDVTNRLFVLLSPSSRKLLNRLDFPLPGNILIYGPPGSGKTTLCRAVAKHVEENEEILAHIVYISCSKLSVEKNTKIRQEISEQVSDALAHSPSIIVLDDLDNIISVSSESEGSQLSNPSNSLSKYLTDLMDEYREKSGISCGYGPIAFVASVQSLSDLPQALTSSGRFDFHIQLSVPAVPERLAMLKHELNKRGLRCTDEILSEIASKCDGYDAYDLEILVDRAVHSALGRFLSYKNVNKGNPNLTKEDFTKAMHDFVPVAMRGIMKIASDDKSAGWEDVGGLTETRNAIQETIEMPSKFPGIFAKSPLRLRSNILLYGPPGCGKTHIVGSAAAASSLRFISVKGPELLNKYIGASEQAVRDLFAKAAAAAPCLLFFDEFDSIAPKRGHDNTGVTDRVVNQLLTELDGVETLTGVFVFAATSRPDLLDAALLRPGRFDRLLFCDFPQWRERLDILTVLSKKLPLASDVILEDIASVTEGFSGADLQALLSDAQLAAVHEILDRRENSTSESGPLITDSLLKSVASKARPSISESEKRRLYDIYNHFMDSKKSVSAQMRDVKGKRVTLA